MADSEHNLIDTLADEFLERLQRGETPSISEYEQAHPECAAEIRRVFSSVQMFEQMAKRRVSNRLSGLAATRPPEQLGDYRIVREIGRGGMGVVYEAEQMSLGRRVAVKVLPRQFPLDLRSAQRFAREAQTAGKLHHTNIVPVFGVGQDAGYHYYVMQLIEGVGLDAVLARLQELGLDATETGIDTNVETPAAGWSVDSLEGFVQAVFEERDLETIVSKATAREPDQRYPSAAELARDLRCFLEDRPIHARRITPVELLWRWCRRNRAIAGLAASALTLLVLVAVVASIGYVRTKNANIQVTAALTKAETISGLSLQALDEIFERFAPDRSVALSELTMAGPEGEGIRVPVQPVLSKETAALLEHMIGFYGRLAQAGAGDVELRQKVANANRRVGDIRQRLGQGEQAEGAYVQALELYQQLQQEHAGDASVVRELARIHNEIGNLQLARGRPAEAHASHEKSLETLAVIPLEPSTSAQHRFELARTYYLLGKRPGRESGPGPPGPAPGPDREGDDRQGPPPPKPPAGEAFPYPDPDTGPGPQQPDADQGDGEANLGRAIAILEPLVAQRPSSPEYGLMLARCYREFPPPKPGRAESPDPNPLEKATEVLRKLAKDYPDVPDYRYELCETLATPRFPGPRFVAEEDPDAERRLRTALELSQALVREHPNIPEYAAAQIHTHHKLAHLLRDTDRPQEAEASLRTALALQAALVGLFPSVSSHRVWQAVIQESLANLLSERGELNESRSLLEGAVATLNDCQAQEGKPAYSRLLSRNYEHLADVLSRLGEREQAEAARSLAQESGFGDGPPPPERRITREPAPP